MYECTYVCMYVYMYVRTYVMLTYVVLVFINPFGKEEAETK